ncbi:hypothetical protein GCM10027456_52060 [Kineosporia babensis]|uniref:Uncharacterized protein n=1 Tax=Kineosporia babensis TaxID=499548 RepID=A0A9X1NG10_9ACTN|nr:hypothetical protein [Kineosporia babensis]MCD5312378.1 hypothetical protein [Kineosporia babensis]
MVSVELRDAAAQLAAYLAQTSSSITKKCERCPRLAHPAAETPLDERAGVRGHRVRADLQALGQFARADPSDSSTSRSPAISRSIRDPPVAAQ